MIKLKNIKRPANKMAGNLGLARRSLIIIISATVVIAIGAFGFLRPKAGGSDSSNTGTGLFTVERGDLTISVTESGDIKAVDSVDIKSKVEGRATIVNIVPEGTNITPEDVNDGKVLVEMMAQQAAQYAPIVQGVGVKKITAISEGGFEVSTTGGPYKARALIMATGATNRHIDVPGEREFAGRGVSYCSTCDGYLFKDGRETVVVGGGNSALTDALYLESIGANVTVVHRKKSFRAQERLQQSLRGRKIPVLFSHEVQSIKGRGTVGSIVLKDLISGKKRELKTDAVFVAIGYVPNSDLAKDLGLLTDPEGYIKTDSEQRTAVPFVYAAGDVTGGVKQIAVAAGQGSVAAISAFEDLSTPYWSKKKKKKL